MADGDNDTTTQSNDQGELAPYQERVERYQDYEDRLNEYEEKHNPERGFFGGIVWNLNHNPVSDWLWDRGYEFRETGLGRSIRNFSIDLYSNVGAGTMWAGKRSANFIANLRLPSAPGMGPLPGTGPTLRDGVNGMFNWASGLIKPLENVEWQILERNGWNYEYQNARSYWEEVDNNIREHSDLTIQGTLNAQATMTGMVGAAGKVAWNHLTPWGLVRDMHNNYMTHIKGTPERNWTWKITDEDINFTESFLNSNETGIVEILEKTNLGPEGRVATGQLTPHQKFTLFGSQAAAEVPMFFATMATTGGTAGLIYGTGRGSITTARSMITARGLSTPVQPWASISTDALTTAGNWGRGTYQWSLPITKTGSLSPIGLSLETGAATFAGTMMRQQYNANAGTGENTTYHSRRNDIATNDEERAARNDRIEDLREELRLQRSTQTELPVEENINNVQSSLVASSDIDSETQPLLSRDDFNQAAPHKEKLIAADSNMPFNSAVQNAVYRTEITIPQEISETIKAKNKHEEQDSKPSFTKTIYAQNTLEEDVYVVQAGDTLSEIVHNHYQELRGWTQIEAKTLEIADYNNIRNPDLIEKGDIIRFPNPDSPLILAQNTITDKPSFT